MQRHSEDIQTEKHFQVDTDWQRNWHASLAVKVTAPLLWLIVIASIVFSIITQRNIERELMNDFNLKADWIAYQINENVTEHNLKNDLSNVYVRKLQEVFGDRAFVGLELNYRNEKHVQGNSCKDLYMLKRKLRLGSSSFVTEGSAGQAELSLCHDAIDTLSRDIRKRSLLYYGVPFLLLGFMMAGMVHLIVTRPIQDMVKITKQVADGETDVQMNENREDEFGDLARFVNQMLDSVNLKHSELRDAVEMSTKASKAKSIFLANMSHELRTPLNAIIGYSEMILDEYEQEEDSAHTKDLLRILNSARHLLELIDGILDLSKIEAGRMEISAHEHDLVELTRSVVELIQPAMQANGNELEFGFTQSEIAMVSDETKIRQILFNLLSNAAKFTSDGLIKVLVDKVDYGNAEWVNITIEDNGTGMTQAQQQIVFQDFTQADFSTTREYGGTGLGLTITQRFCRMLGGEITLVSTQGQGSTFIIELPLIYQAPESE